MGQADKLYEVARVHQPDVLREVELARMVASAQRSGASRPQRPGLATVLGLISVLPKALDMRGQFGRPVHA